MEKFWHKIAENDLPQGEYPHNERDVLFATYEGITTIGYYNAEFDEFWGETGIIFGRKEVVAWAEVPRYKGK